MMSFPVSVMEPAGTLINAKAVPPTGTGYSDNWLYFLFNGGIHDGFSSCSGTFKRPLDHKVRYKVYTDDKYSGGVQHGQTKSGSVYRRMSAVR